MIYIKVPFRGLRFDLPMLRKAILKFNYMNNFDKTINECFEILDMIELLIEEKDYMFISDYYRKLSNDINFLKKNINNENVITNKRIKDMEALAKRVEDEYNTIQYRQLKKNNKIFIKHIPLVYYQKWMSLKNILKFGILFIKIKNH